jgi:hypothetical protein
MAFLRKFYSIRKARYLFAHPLLKATFFGLRRTAKIAKEYRKKQNYLFNLI